METHEIRRRTDRTIRSLLNLIYDGLYWFCSFILFIALAILTGIVWVLDWLFGN